MIRMLDSLSWRKIIVLVFAVAVIGSTAAEIVEEISTGEPLSAMADDIAMFVVGVVVAIMLAMDYFSQQKALAQLRADLEKSSGRLARIDANSPQIANQYRRVMQKQFDAWNLTNSEQDVVLGLLKGLSFREIAEIRETREKTVRQQATNVYRKAGVAGRHELAGWFFEDLLQSPGTNVQ